MTFIHLAAVHVITVHTTLSTKISFFSKSKITLTAEFTLL